MDAEQKLTLEIFMVIGAFLLILWLTWIALSHLTRLKKYNVVRLSLALSLTVAVFAFNYLLEVALDLGTIVFDIFFILGGAYVGGEYYKSIDKFNKLIKKK